MGFESTQQQPVPQPQQQQQQIVYLNSNNNNNGGIFLQPQQQQYVVQTTETKTVEAPLVNTKLGLVCLALSLVRFRILSILFYS